MLRIQLLTVAAGGVGAIVGWHAITDALWARPPPVTVDVLTGIAAAARIIGLIAVVALPMPGIGVGVVWDERRLFGR
jgi:hypothetical protein